MSRELVDSNIYYLGKIPNNWISNKYKYFSDLRMGETILASSTVSEGIPIYSATKGDKIFGYVKEANVKLKKGELVIPARGNSIGYVSIVKEKEATCTQTTICSYNIHDINNKFLYYSILGLNNEWFKFDGSAIPQITVEQVKDCILAIPPENEQELIVEYLDNRVLLIDETIENNKKEIELLEEYKNNILDTLCLKGICKRDFKNSNHYSIDKIPSDWNFQKTLGVLNMPITDGPHLSPNFVSDGIPFISADAIKDGKIDFSRKRGDISEKDFLEFSKKYTPKLHDIYMIKSGATTGKIGIVETTNKFTIWSPLAVFRVNEQIMNYKYLYYLLQTNFYQKQVQLNWSYGTQQNIGMRVLEKLKVLVPSLVEQEQIVKEIDKKVVKLDKVIEYRKQIIEKLEEYKKSLIYEAVTGKIEV